MLQYLRICICFKIGGLRGLTIRTIMQSQNNVQTKCLICQSTMVQPITFDCGHSFCINCFENNLGDGGIVKKCSECRRFIHIKTMKQDDEVHVVDLEL